jgi:hypothetical protein
MSPVSSKHRQMLINEDIKIGDEVQELLEIKDINHGLMANYWDRINAKITFHASTGARNVYDIVHPDLLTENDIILDPFDPAEIATGAHTDRPATREIRGETDKSWTRKIGESGRGDALGVGSCTDRPSVPKVAYYDQDRPGVALSNTSSPKNSFKKWMRGPPLPNGKKIPKILAGSRKNSHGNSFSDWWIYGMDKTGTFGDKLKIQGRHVGANFAEKPPPNSERNWKNALGFKR